MSTKILNFEQTLNEALNIRLWIFDENFTKYPLEG